MTYGTVVDPPIDNVAFAVGPRLAPVIAAFECPICVPDSDNPRPALYVVLVGTAQVPSPLKNLVLYPLAGAGTSPAFQAADAVAPVMLE